MKTGKLSILLFATFVLVLGSVAADFVSADNTFTGCPDRFFDAERGCQVPIVMEYEEVTETLVEAAVATDCPDRFFDAERGCQIPIIMEYAEEYALVNDEVAEEIIRDCPSRFFESEKGCQVPIIMEYTIK